MPHCFPTASIRRDNKSYRRPELAKASFTSPHHQGTFWIIGDVIYAFISDAKGSTNVVARSARRMGVRCTLSGTIWETGGVSTICPPPPPGPLCKMPQLQRSPLPWCTKIYDTAPDEERYVLAVYSSVIVTVYEYSNFVVFMLFVEYTYDSVLVSC